MAQIIEAVARIRGEDATGAAFASVAKKLAEIGKAAKSSAEVSKLGRELAQLGKSAQAAASFRDTLAAFTNARATFRAAQADMAGVAKSLDAARKAAAQFDGIKAFSRNSGIAREIAETRKQVGELERAYAQSQRAVRGAASAFEAQAAAVKAARRAASEGGIDTGRLAAEQLRLKASVDATTAAMLRQARAADTKQVLVERRQLAAAQRASLLEQTAARAASRREAVGNLVTAGAGLVAGYKAKQFATNAITQAADLDKYVRYQRVATDVTPEKQRDLLIPQAKRIGQATEFSNADIVRAQTATMQSLPMKDPNVKAEVGAALIEQVRFYAQIMTADMERSAEGIRSFLQNTNKDISTKEKAVAEATRATNLLVKMAKSGGMNDEDVQQFMKYGAPTATASGLSDTTMGALGAVGRRSGLRGDELGTFLRAAASKLVAPTSKGLDALTAAGIDYNSFVRMPEAGLNTTNLERFSQRRFGKGFSASQRSRIGDILENGDVIADRDKLIAELTPIIAEGFERTKKGKTKAQDSQKIAKMVNDFAKLSVESTDTEGLLRAIMSNPKMSIPLLNAFFTDKHGGKASVLATNFGQFREDRASLEKVTEDPGFAAGKAAEITDGLYGSLNNLKGSVETLTTSFGEANAAWLKISFDRLGNVADSFTALPDSAKQAATALAAIGAAVGGVKTVQAFAGGFGLNASAVALDGAAAALTRAAVAQGGSGVIGGAAATGKPVLGARLGQLGSLGFLGTVGLGVGAMVGTGYALDYFLPTSRAGTGPKKFNDKNSLYKGEEVGPGFNAGLSPAGWGTYDVSKGAGARGASFQTDVERQRSWWETSRYAPKKDTYQLPVPPSMSFAPTPGAPLEAKVVPDQIQAKLDGRVPVDVTGKVESELKGQADVRVTVTVDGPATASVAAFGTGHVRASASSGRSMPAATNAARQSSPGGQGGV